MRDFVRRCFYSVALVGALLASAQASEGPGKSASAAPYTPDPWLLLYGGFTAAPDSWYAYAGGVAALNRNLNQDGWLFRIAGGTGHYKYNIVPGLSNGVDFQTGDVMVGYQAYLGATRVTGYIGANVENHDNNADPLAKLKGTKWGVKGQGEIFAPLKSVLVCVRTRIDLVGLEQLLGDGKGWLQRHALVVDRTGSYGSGKRPL